MSDPLYTKDILRLAADIPRHMRLDEDVMAAGRSGSVTKVSPICGSKVDVDLVVEDGKVAAYGQQVRACALGQAAAAIMGAHILGRPVDEVRALPAILKTFLRGDGPCPQAPWDALHIFAPAKQHKGRHASILLCYEAAASILATLPLQSKGSCNSAQPADVI